MSKNILLYISIVLLISCNTNVQEKPSSSITTVIQDVTEDNNTIINKENIYNSYDNEELNTPDSLVYKQNDTTILVNFTYDLFITDVASFKLEGFSSAQNLPTQSIRIAKYSKHSDIVEYTPLELYNNFPKSGLKFYKGIEACKIWGHVTDTILVNIYGEDSIISHIESYELSIDINNKLIIDTLP